MNIFNMIAVTFLSILQILDDVLIYKMGLMGTCSQIFFSFHMLSA